MTSEELYVKVPNCADLGSHTYEIEVTYDDGDTELFLNFPDHTSLDNVIENIIPNYYKNWKYKYISYKSFSYCSL